MQTNFSEEWKTCKYDIRNFSGGKKETLKINGIYVIICIEEWKS